MAASVEQKAWATVALAFLFMLINFADKAIVGLASVPIMRDLGLSHRQFGLLGSAFFFLFSISGITIGILSNRMRTKVLMLAMAGVWSAALLPVLLASSFSVLLASRIVLGAAEGPAFPVAMHSVYKWFGDSRRALPTSVVASGAAFGTGVVAPLLSWVIVRHGWHGAFGTLAGVGLLWACLWFALAEEGPLHPSSTATSAVPPVAYRRLLSSRTAVGVYLAGFAAYWIIALNVVWLANYLIKVVHLRLEQAAWTIALASLLQMALAPGCAFLSSNLARWGYSSRISRGLLGSLCVMCGGVSLSCIPFAGAGALEIVLVGVGFSIGSVIFTLGTTLIGEISPATQRGAMLGITNSIHTLAGICAPFVMGLFIDIHAGPTEGFRLGFLCAGCFVALLGIFAALLIDPEADIRKFRSSRICTS